MRFRRCLQRTSPIGNRHQYNIFSGANTTEDFAMPLPRVSYLYKVYVSEVSFGYPFVQSTEKHCWRVLP